MNINYVLFIKLANVTVLNKRVKETLNVQHVNAITKPPLSQHKANDTLIRFTYRYCTHTHLYLLTSFKTHLT